MENLLNKIFPPKCLFCKRVGDIFCEDCISNCLILSTQYCIVCGKPSFSGMTHQYCLKKGIPIQNLSVFEYSGLTRECIRKSKYYSKQFMALKRLSYEGTNLLYDWGFSFDNFVIVPIPLNKQKEALRGFNHVDKIADYVSYRFKLPKENSILTRVKNTKAQHGYTRTERFLNIKDSFASSPDLAKDKKVLLVDDICTSGATLLEASKVSYNAGALEVRCFTLSRKSLG